MTRASDFVLHSLYYSWNIHSDKRTFLREIMHIHRIKKEFEWTYFSSHSYKRGLHLLELLQRVHRLSTGFIKDFHNFSSRYSKIYAGQNCFLYWSQLDFDLLKINHTWNSILLSDGFLFNLNSSSLYFNVLSLSLISLQSANILHLAKYLYLYLSI